MTWHRPVALLKALLTPTPRCDAGRAGYGPRCRLRAEWVSPGRRPTTWTRNLRWCAYHRHAHDVPIGEGSGE